MKTNPLKEGVISEHSGGLGTVTPERVRTRAAELALIDGYLSSDAIESHFAEARRELTGVADGDPQEAILDAASESERWDPAPGSTGHKVAPTPSTDEDDEGRSDNQRLVEEGVEGAEHDQKRQDGGQTGAITRGA